MAGLLRVEGVWPSPVTLTAGWYRARARPWNDEVADPMIRLDRGSSEFLLAVARHFQDLGAEAVYSPALFPTTTRIWRRAGFSEHASLDVMERPLNSSSSIPTGVDTTSDNPSWVPILHIDRLAFEGFWGMSEQGLADAFATNKRTALLTTGSPEPAGYALVGAQWGVAYLHRIAVRPDRGGEGLGRLLMEASFSWAYGAGARTMVLNVRSENSRAIRLYERTGFVKTPTELQVFTLKIPKVLD